MRFIMNYLVPSRVCEIIRIGYIFGNVRNEAHVFNVVVNEIIFLRSILFPDWAESFDYHVIVHVCFNLQRLSSISEQVFFHFESQSLSVELVQTVSQLSVEHLFAVLLQEIKIFVLRR